MNRRRAPAPFAWCADRTSSDLKRDRRDAHCRRRANLIEGRELGTGPVPRASCRATARKPSMANFPTHIAIGTVVSGALATVTAAADLVAPENIVAVTLAGVLGSVLPDIDLKDSRPAHAMFAGLAVFFSFAVLFSLERRYSIAEMLILWVGTLLLVRYVGKAVFFRFSYHRGIWHSLLAMAFCALITSWIYYRPLGRDPAVAWLAAGF